MFEIFDNRVVNFPFFNNELTTHNTAISTSKQSPGLLSSYAICINLCPGKRSITSNMDAERVSNDGTS
jgi:hypothetical protein